MSGKMAAILSQSQFVKYSLCFSVQLLPHEADHTDEIEGIVVK